MYILIYKQIMTFTLAFTMKYRYDSIPEYSSHTTHCSSTPVKNGRYSTYVDIEALNKAKIMEHLLDE